MQALQHSFTVLECCGLWQPMHWSQALRTKFYSLYTCLIMFLFVTLILSQLIGIVSSVDNIDDFAHNVFLFLTLVADVGKAINILIKRGDIIKLVKSLQEDPCRPINEEELLIQRKFDRMVRLNTLRYMIVVSFAVIVVVLRSMIEDIVRRTLPYKSWWPFEYRESWIGYSIVYSHQICGLLIGASIGIAFDTLVPGLMIQTRAQLNILMHRFHKMPEMLLEIASGDVNRDNEDQPRIRILNAENSLLSQHVQHHLAIFKFAQKSNDFFTVMIFLQYAISTFILCMSLVRVTKLIPFSSAFISAFVAMTEMSIQILLYCYYGGDVSIESLKVGDAIYEMDWHVLSTNARRSLLTIMARTLRPITFTTIHVITLNLESFKSLVKLSYSIYNVL